MLLVVLALLCLVSVPATGADLRHLAAIKVRLSSIAAAALLSQIIITEIWTSGSSGLHRALQLASYVLAGVFVVANRRIPGMALMALGGALNLTAIAANAGVMPASGWAIAHSGLTIGHGFSNSAPVTHPHLLWLGDVIPVPAGPLANVLSVGDVLIFVGLLLLLQRSCRRDAREKRPPQQTSASACPSVPSGPRLACDHAATDPVTAQGVPTGLRSPGTARPLDGSR
jgi:hypothetical protein